jgi:5-formyltetrahydrofolate cyclo-ligase
MATESGLLSPEADQEDEAGALAAASIRARKQAMRKEIRSQLGGLSESDLAGESARVWERLAELPQYAEARSVGVFLSMPSSEIRTEALVADASRRGKRLYVPAVGRNFESPDMEMLEVPAAAIPPGDDGGGGDGGGDGRPAGAPFYAAWPRNKWHIPEPPPSTRAGMRAAEPGDIDLLVVPGLAFDRRGGRLGQGKGYYDRFLHRMAPAAPVAVVAVGLRCQLVEEVPTLSDDHPVDIVVLPDEVIHVKKGTGRG